MKKFKNWQIAAIVASAISWIYLSVLSHLLMFENVEKYGFSNYKALLVSFLLTILIGFVILAINIVSWVLDYNDERKLDK